MPFYGCSIFFFPFRIEISSDLIWGGNRLCE